jgi:O-antigen/teichoic acid export membrane protein
MCIEATWPTLPIGRCGLSESRNVKARDSAPQSFRTRLALGSEQGNVARSGGRRVVGIAIALFSTTLMTAGLGFLFWAVAAHITTTEVVGRASAVISAMQLIGTFATLGFHMLLTAELPRRDAADVKRLVVTSLGIAGGLAFVTAAGYAVVAHVFTRTSEWIYATPTGIALFGFGTAITTVAVVLDGALIGVQLSGRQASRNLIFSLVKLIALPVAAFAVGLSPQAVFAAWLVGNLVSLLTLGLRTRTPQEWLRTMPSLRQFSPLWRSAAGGYHWINLASHAPLLIMPIMVTAQLGAHANAGFYAALLLVGVVWTIPCHLATAMLTLDGGDTNHFDHGLSVALRVSAAVSVLTAVGAPIVAGPVLAVFGPGYEQARYCLIAFATCTFASAIKSIYVPVRRAQGALSKAAVAVILGACIEVGAAEIGLRLGGVTGVGMAFGAAMVLEALAFWPAIRRARMTIDQKPLDAKPIPVRQKSESPDVNRFLIA